MSYSFLPLTFCVLLYLYYGWNLYNNWYLKASTVHCLFTYKTSFCRSNNSPRSFPLVFVKILIFSFTQGPSLNQAVTFAKTFSAFYFVRKNDSCNLHDMLWENVLGLTAFRGRSSCALPQPGTIVGREEALRSHREAGHRLNPNLSLEPGGL